MISCKGYWTSSVDGDEFDCEYDPDFACDDCIINGGRMSPQTGKPFRGNRAKYEERARRPRTENIIDSNGRPFQFKVGKTHVKKPG